MIDYLNSNAGAVTALATVALLLVTGWYAWTTRALLREAQQTRLMSGEPRVVAYLRVNEVHQNIVQLFIANLSSAAATEVSASIRKVTEWPLEFKLEGSKVLRDLKFLRPHETMRFDVGIGPELFRDKEPAIFEARIEYRSLDGRSFQYEDELRVESVDGFASWRIYGIDDIARRLEQMAKTLDSFGNFKRFKVETYNAEDRAEEHRLLQERRSRS